MELDARQTEELRETVSKQITQVWAMVCDKKGHSSDPVLDGIVSAAGAFREALRSDESTVRFGDHCQGFAEPN